MSSMTHAVRSMLVVAGLVAGEPVGAQATTRLFLNSEPGDYIGNGEKRDLSPANGTFSASRSTASGFEWISVAFTGSQGTWWRVTVASPQGSPLAPGLYENARRFSGAAWAGLDVSGEGRGCNALLGRFIVREVESDAEGTLTRLAVDFEQHCESASAALHGSLRYNATVPASADLAIRFVSSPEGLSGPATYKVVVTNYGPDLVSGAQIEHVTTPQLLQQSWSCTASAGATCSPQGQGPLADLASLPPGGSVSFVVQGLLPDPRPSVLLASASVAAPAGTGDWKPANNTASVNTDDANGSIATLLDLNSQAGDTVGGGVHRVLTTSGGRFNFRSDSDRLDLRFTGPNQDWTVTLEAPGGMQLIPGVYERAQSRPGAILSRPTISISGNGRGCTESGRFVILEIERDPLGFPTRLAADFEQRCVIGSGSLFGSVRLNSTLRIEPRLTVSEGAVLEGRLSSVPARVSVSLFQPTGPATIDWRTLDGTAIAPEDYAEASGQLALSPARTSEDVTVAVAADTEGEPVEDLAVSLQSASGARLAIPSGRIRILDGSGTQTWLRLHGEAGDGLVGDSTVELTEADGRFTTQRLADDSVEIAYDGEVVWKARFRSPTGGDLLPGAYAAVAHPNNPPESVAGMLVAPASGPCSTIGGFLVVHEAEYLPDGSVASFAADFEQRCGGRQAAIRGGVRYRSAYGPTHDLAVRFPRSPTADGSGSSVSFDLVVTNHGPEPAIDAGVRAAFDGMTDATWACQPATSSTPASGTGNLNTVIVLGLGEAAVCRIDGMLVADSLLRATASASGAIGMDWRPANDSASFDAASPPPQTFLYLRGDAGDWVSAGREVLLGEEDGWFQASGGPSGLGITFRGPPSAEDWHLRFSPADGDALAPGLYVNAQRDGLASPTRPGLDVSANGRGCNAISGRFVVLEAEYDASGLPLKLAVDFEQHCDGAAPALYGALRINSSLQVTPRLSIGGAAVIERGGRTQPAHVLIWLSQRPAQNVEVNYQTVDGSAQSGEDYRAVAGSIVLTPSQPWAEVQIEVLDEGLPEPDETFSVSILAPQTLPVAVSQGLVSIVDGEQPHSFVELDSEDGEWLSGGRDRLLSPIDGRFTATGAEDKADVRFDGGSPLDDWEFAFIAPSMQGLVSGAYEGASRAPLQSPLRPGLGVTGRSVGCNYLSGRFVVLEAERAASGLPERLAVDFEHHCDGAVPALFGALRYNSTVDVIPRVSVSDSRVIEDGTETRKASVTIAASLRPEGDIAVEFTTVDGTAVAGQDYEAVAGSVRLTASKPAVQIEVPILDDGLAEPDESFSVRLVQVQGAPVAFDTGVVTVLDGESPRSMVALNSVAGEPLGQGEVKRLTVVDGLFDARSGPNGAAEIRYRGDGYWYGTFDAPGPGPTGPGSYEHATRYPFQSPGVPGLDVSGNHLGCGHLTGRFVVLEAEYGAAGEIDRFAANFEQTCIGSPGPLYGAFRYRSNVGASADLAVHVLTPPPSATRGMPVEILIQVLNHGPETASGVRLEARVLPALTSVSWSCAPGPGASCTSSGTGDLSDLLVLPVAGSATYAIRGLVQDLPGDLEVQASLTPPASLIEWNSSNDSVAHPIPLTDRAGGPGSPEARTDFDGDGHADILWQHRRSGTLLFWFMDGASLVRTGLGQPPSLPSGYSVVATCDWNQDGEADLVLRGPTGRIVVWLLDGAARIGEVVLEKKVGSGNTLLGAHDFDDDGHVDFLVRNDRTGVLRFWIMAGGALVRKLTLTPKTANGWQFAGLADIDGVAGLDIIWRSDNGKRGARHYAWLMDGSTRATIVELVGLPSSADPKWRVVAVGDYDGDGDSDFVWQHNATALLRVSIMQAAQQLRVESLDPDHAEDPDFRVIGPR